MRDPEGKKAGGQMVWVRQEGAGQEKELAGLHSGGSRRGEKEGKKKKKGSGRRKT